MVDPHLELKVGGGGCLFYACPVFVLLSVIFFTHNKGGQAPSLDLSLVEEMLLDVTCYSNQR